ncbi:class I SAM-dependent methyltransferase [Patescibacteria group bacterium]|nr:class I SAM-dependent methyltransferase [Patescibacteria group bacterium]
MGQNKILQANRNLSKEISRSYNAEHLFCNQIWNSYWTDIKLIDSILKNKKEPVILDVGCGTGLLSKAFLELGYTLYALDLSPDMLDLYKYPGKGKLIKICIEVEKFFEENTQKYDLIMFAASLHHIYEYKKVIRMALGMLKEDGLIFIFNEPLKKRSLLELLDAFINKLIHSPKKVIPTVYDHLFKKTSDAVLADYYLNHERLDMGWIIKEMPKIIQIHRYPLVTYSVMYQLLEKLEIKNWFSLIAQK